MLVGQRRFEQLLAWPGLLEQPAIKAAMSAKLAYHSRYNLRHHILILEFQSGTFGGNVTLAWTKTSDQCRFAFRDVALHFVSLRGGKT